MSHSSGTPLSRPVDRRGFLRGALGVGALALGGTAVLSACGGGTASQAATSGGTSGSLQTGWVPTVEQAGSYIADSRGYYRDAGIDLGILSGGPNTAVDSVVISGKALIGNSNTDIVADMITNGAPVKVIGARFQTSPFCAYSLADRAITSPRELVGKRVGCAAGNEGAFKTFLGLNGLSLSDVTLVPVQFDPAPTANGEVDAQVGFSIDQPATLRAQGHDVHTMLFSDFGYNILSSALFATTQSIEAQPDLLASFLTGERRGWQDNVKDPAEGARLAVDVYGKNTGLDLKQQTLASQGTTALVVSDDVPASDILALTDTAIAGNIATLAKAGVHISANDLFDTSILGRVQ
ncbi:ABC transporter substrate-binding protein [Streptomyces sp. SID6673]|nr:ABC transporter substrate-binding protein [Streptomyces sp. SID11726]NEB26608.1 ABC transporter substrate-binding protein [Streptomyces sp. SID6673]